MAILCSWCLDSCHQLSSIPSCKMGQCAVNLGLRSISTAGALSLSLCHTCRCVLPGLPYHVAHLSLCLTGTSLPCVTPVAVSDLEFQVV